LAPLNELLLPLIKVGVGAPFLNPIGLVVLEVAGRRSGRIYSVPLVAWSLGNLVVVSTVRSESAWVKNLRAAGAAAIWLRGRRREAVTLRELLAPCAGLHAAVLAVQPIERIAA
jgi:hypothetical protein